MKKIIPAALAGGFFLSVTGQEALAATGQEVVNQANKFQGAQYVYGAPAFSTTEFDCSSFTQMIYQEAAGISLPRTAAEQATKGVAVSRNSLQPGDLLFFDTGDGGINHVGIYIGNGQMISSELTYGVHITNVFSGGGAQSYWEPRFVTARRVINQSSVAVQQSSQPISQSSVSVYTVKNGDSLWAIAQSHGVSVAAIKAANGLGSNIIYPGQKLKLFATAQGTASVSVSAAAETVSNSPSSATGKVYTVKSGDNLWAIAQSHNTSVNALKNANGLKSDMIYPGQKLKLSAAAPAVAPVEAKVVAKTSAPQSSSDGGSYHVEGGDSLWAIATLHGITVNKLMRANHLSSTLIYPGQNLVIPV